MLFELLDAAISGLGSAAIMTLFELPFWKKWGMKAVAEWQVNWVMVSRLLGRPEKIQDKVKIPWATIAMHLLHGVAVAVIFSVIILPFFLAQLPMAKLSIPLDAVVYSVVLWIMTPALTRRIFETAGRIQITSQGLIVSLVSHIVYGIFLGLFQLLV